MATTPHFSKRLKNDHQRSPSDESYVEKGMASKVAIVTAEEAEDDQETRPAHRIHYGAAIFDVVLAILPLYFVVFAVLGFLRNDTLASSFRNQALFRMAALVRTHRQYTDMAKLTDPQEPNVVSHHLRLDRGQVHQSSCYLETGARCYRGTHSIATGIALTCLVHDDSMEAAQHKPCRPTAGTSLDHEPCRWPDRASCGLQEISVHCRRCPVLLSGPQHLNVHSNQYHESPIQHGCEFGIQYCSL